MLIFAQEVYPNILSPLEILLCKAPINLINKNVLLCLESHIGVAQRLNFEMPNSYILDQVNKSTNKNFVRSELVNEKCTKRGVESW